MKSVQAYFKKVNLGIVFSCFAIGLLVYKVIKREYQFKRSLLDTDADRPESYVSVFDRLLHKGEYFMERVFQNYVELFQKNTDLAAELLSDIDPSLRTFILGSVIIVCVLLLFFFYKKKLAVAKTPSSRGAIIIKIYNRSSYPKAFLQCKKPGIRKRAKILKVRTKVKTIKNFV